MAAMDFPPPPTVTSRSGLSAQCRIARATTSGAYTGGGRVGSSSM